MSRRDDLKQIVTKSLAPAAIGVGLALTSGCGGEPDDAYVEDEAADLEGKADSVKNKCATNNPNVKFGIFVKQKLTASKMKTIAACAIENLVVVDKCGIGCDAFNPVVLYMSPPTPPPVARYATPPANNGVVALYSAPVKVCDANVDWILPPASYLTAARMQKLVQCAELAVDENCGVGCQLNNPVSLYSAPVQPVARYMAPIDE